MKRQRKRVDGKLIYVYKVDRDVLDDGSRWIILEAIALRYQMGLIDNSGNKPSTVPSVSNNIETKGQVEHSDLEVDGQSAVLPVTNNIETKGEVEYLELEVELQTSGPWSANYIDSDGERGVSDCYRELRVLKTGKSAHAWGRLLCIEQSRQGCQISIWL